MQSRPLPTHDSRTLLVDVNPEHDGRPLEQLNRAGFRTDFAMSWSAAPRVWIIVLSDLQPENALARPHRQDIDAVLSAPFSMSDLTSRLAAFSLRARPTF